MKTPSKKCQCSLCVKWAPLHRRIRAKLRGKDLAMFDEYVMLEMQQADDLGSALAKLSGDWPGWEAMKNFKTNDD